MSIDLIEAVFDGNILEVERLLKSGCDPNFCAPHGNNVMSAAVQSDNTHMVKLLLDFGGDINSEIDYKSPVDGREKKGFTAIFYANEAEMLKFVIENGANINHRDSNGITPLMYFAKFCDLDCISILLSFGADKSVKSNANVTALDIVNDTLHGYESIARRFNDNDSNQKILKAEECISILQ